MKKHLTFSNDYLEEQQVIKDQVFNQFPVG